MLRVMEAVTDGPIGLNFDPAAFVMAGVNPSDAFRKFHSVVTHVFARVRCAMRNPASKFRSVAARLRGTSSSQLFDEASYHGWLTIDRTQGDDRRWRRRPRRSVSPTDCTRLVDNRKLNGLCRMNAQAPTPQILSITQVTRELKDPSRRTFRTSPSGVKSRAARAPVPGTTTSPSRMNSRSSVQFSGGTQQRTASTFTTGSTSSPSGRSKSTRRAAHTR
jgi:hypothetical protein